MMRMLFAAAWVVFAYCEIEQFLPGPLQILPDNRYPWAGSALALCALCMPLALYSAHLLARRRT